MPEDTNEPVIAQIAHVLTIALICDPNLSADQRVPLMAQLDVVVGSSTRFRVAQAAGKLVCRAADQEMTLVFYGEPDAAMECAVEIATGLKEHPNIAVRMGLHSGPVAAAGDPNEQSNVDGQGVDAAREVMVCGDAGHILLSKRVAYDLAPLPRWSAHLFEIGDCVGTDGQNVSVVNFHTGEVGNPEIPAKIKRALEEKQSRVRRAQLRRRLKITAIAVAIPLTIAIAAIVVRRELGERAAAAISEKSLAVLPLVDLSPARDQEYFCDGISEEIRDLLAKIDGLRVAGWTSSLSFKGKNTGVGELGQKLNVASVLQGTLQRDGNRIRANIKIFNARNGYQILSGTFDREMADVFVLQNEIRRAVVNALRVKAAPPSRPLSEENTEAYNLYLQGLFLSNKNDEVDLRKSVELFQRAFEEDPKLSRAATGIARGWFRLAQGYVKPLDAYPRVRVAAQKALALDDNDPEARCYLGETKRILEWDLKGEEAELRRAIQIDANSANTHVFLGQLRASLGDREKYLGQTRTALRLDPLSPAIVNAQVTADVDTNHLGEALAEAKRMIEIDPSYTYFEPALALVYREQGKLREALDIYARLEQTRRQPTSGLAITYARLENPEQAKRVLDQLIQRAEAYYFPADQIAAVYVALGENDNAVHWLKRAIEEHSSSIHRLSYAREFEKLRNDPSFPELLKRIGLDPEKLNRK